MLPLTRKSTFHFYNRSSQALQWLTSTSSSTKRARNVYFSKRQLISSKQTKSSFQTVTKTGSLVFFTAKIYNILFVSRDGFMFKSLKNFYHCCGKINCVKDLFYIEAPTPKNAVFCAVSLTPVIVLKAQLLWPPYCSTTH